jgi:hypothetical protein
MTYKTKRTLKHYVEVDGLDVEIENEPYDDPIVERVGDRLVVGYLVQDQDCENPLKSSDCNGEIITKGSAYRGNSLITDDRQRLYRELGLDSYGGVDIDKGFPCEPYTDLGGLQQTRTTLRSLGAFVVFSQVMADDDMKVRWFESLGVELVEGGTYDVNTFVLRHNLEDVNSVFSEEVEAAALDLYPKNWQAIAGPYVLPISYFDERGSSSTSVTSWDGDTNDLPDGVWVACKCAIENLKDQDQVHIRMYANAVLTEYSAWASGEVFGCCVHTYTFAPNDTACKDIEAAIEAGEGEWEINYDADDSCWGFIGHKYAKQSLKDDMFDHAVKRLNPVAQSV